MSHTSLSDYYRGIFELKNTIHEHPFTITEIENLIPWERDILFNLLLQYIQEKKELLDKNG